MPFDNAPWPPKPERQDPPEWRRPDMADWLRIRKPEK